MHQQHQVERRGALALIALGIVVLAFLGLSLAVTTAGTARFAVALGYPPEVGYAVGIIRDYLLPSSALSGSGWRPSLGSRRARRSARRSRLPSGMEPDSRAILRDDPQDDTPGRSRAWCGTYRPRPSAILTRRER